MTRTAGEGQPQDRPALERAFGAVLLEGPDGTARAARQLLGCLRDGACSPDDLGRARQGFIDAARNALASD